MWQQRSYLWMTDAHMEDVFNEIQKDSELERRKAPFKQVDPDHMQKIKDIYDNTLINRLSDKKLLPRFALPFVGCVQLPFRF